MQCLENLWLIMCIYALGGVHSNMLHIEDCGLQSWNVDDTALVMYATVSNRGDQIVKDVYMKSDNCCLDPADSGPDNECQIFRVLGDFAPFMKPGSTVNFTLLMPTIYPYDRYGDCMLDLQYDSIYRMQHHIHFDTRLSGDNWQQLPENVRDIVSSMGSCDSPDKDPLRACHPVKCLLKYGADRGYYNQRTKRCEKPPQCTSTPDHPRIFSAETSSCKDEELMISDQKKPNGMEAFKAPIWEEFSLLKKYKKECVHGKMTSTGCQCDWGWTTSTDGGSAFDPVDKVYKLCNTQSEDYIRSLKPNSVIVTLIATSFLAVLLLLVLVAVTQFQSRTAVKRLSQISLSTLRRTLLMREQDEGLNREIFAIARAICSHDPMMDGELTLRVGDVLHELERTETPGMWKGTCGINSGSFPVACVEFFLPTELLPGD